VGTVLASLYSDETWMWVSVGTMTVLTVGLTFLLPKLHSAAPEIGPDPAEPAVEQA
jgi:hypothetical protein